MSDRAKAVHAQLVIAVFLITTAVLFVIYRAFWRSLLFAAVGVFVSALTLAPAFYALDSLVAKAFARLARASAATDGIVATIGCFTTIAEIAATAALTAYAYRAVVL